MSKSQNSLRKPKIKLIYGRFNGVNSKIKIIERRLEAITGKLKSKRYPVMRIILATGEKIVIDPNNDFRPKGVNKEQYAK